MKRNSVLFAIIIFLLGIIYFFIEREEQREYKEAQEKSQLVDFSKLGEIKKVELNDFTIESVGRDRYFNKDKKRFLNTDSVNYLFSQLLKIKVLRKLETTDESMFIPTEAMMISFSFDKGDVKFILGNRTSTGDQFYMKILHDQKSSLILCKKEGAFNIKDPREKKEAAYNHIKGIFSLKESFFVEKRPFRFFETINKVIINSFRNTEFTLNFSKKEIDHDFGFSPRILGEKVESYSSRLKEVNAISVTKNDGLVSTLIGEITVNTYETIKVYRKFGDLNGYFLVLNNYVYEIDSHGFRVIFPHPQDFIDKRIAAEKILLNYSNFSNEDLLLLMSKEAHMISPLYDKEVKRKIFHIRTNKGDYYLDILESDTILYDFSKKIAYHYLETLK